MFWIYSILISILFVNCNARTITMSMSNYLLQSDQDWKTISKCIFYLSDSLPTEASGNSITNLKCGTEKLYLSPYEISTIVLALILGLILLLGFIFVIYRSLKKCQSRNLETLDQPKQENPRKKYGHYGIARCI